MQNLHESYFSPVFISIEVILDRTGSILESKFFSLNTAQSQSSRPLTFIPVTRIYFQCAVTFGKVNFDYGIDSVIIETMLSQVFTVMITCYVIHKIRLFEIK